MTGRGRPLATFIVTSVALFMSSLDNLVVTMALPAIKIAPARVAVEPRVDGQRLHADVRRVAAAGRDVG